MVGLTTLYSGFCSEHDRHTAERDRRTTGVVHVVLGVHGGTGRIIRVIPLATIHVRDGDRSGTVREHGDVHSPVGIRTCDTWAAQKKAECVVERTNERRVFLRAEHVIELDGIADRHEVEFQDAVVGQVTTHDGFQVRVIAIVPDII